METCGKYEQSQESNQAESVPARVGRTLFLGYMHDSLQRERQALRGQLDEAGFKIVPPTSDDPVDEPTVKSAFEIYVKAFNTDVERWPAALKPDGHPLPGYPFCRLERADHPGRPFGWPQPDETDKAYWDGIWKLADSIASQLKRMEYAAARTPVSAGARASAARQRL